MANNCAQDTAYNVFADTVDNIWSKCRPPGTKHVGLVVRGGGDVKIKPVPGGKTHGQRPYVGEKCYDEMMTRMPYSEWIRQVKGRMSVFDKPYEDDEYQETEHFAPTGPIIPKWHFPNLPPAPSDIPEQFWPVEPPPGASWKDFCSITCWDKSGSSTVAEGCDEITGFCYPAVITQGSRRVWDIFAKDNGRLPKLVLHGKQIRDHLDLGGVEIYPDWDYVELVDGERCVTYTVIIRENWLSGEVEKWTFCETEVTICCTVECDCPSDPAFAYTAGNPSTIARNATAPITVDNGCADFSWSVSGTGFTFANSTTATGSNTLQADDTACGMASITVTDNCGTQVTGSVRCTTGTWTLKCTNGTSTTGCSPWYTLWGGDSYETIVGYQKWEMIGNPDATSKCCPSAGVDCTWDDPNCAEPPCGNPCDCDGVIGRCGGISVTLWPSYKYYEWECA